MSATTHRARTIARARLRAAAEQTGERPTECVYCGRKARPNTYPPTCTYCSDLPGLEAL